MTEATKKPTKIEALRAKIAAAQQALANYEAELSRLTIAEDQAAAERAAREQIEVVGLDAYTKVRFQYGRKATRKELTGEVVAFRPEQGSLPAAYRVEVGSGFDTEVLTVPARDVFVVGDNAEAAA